MLTKSKIAQDFPKLLSKLIENFQNIKVILFTIYSIYSPNFDLLVWLNANYYYHFIYYK